MINFVSKSELNPTIYKHSKSVTKINLLPVFKYKTDNGIQSEEGNKIQIYKLIKYLNCLKVNEFNFLIYKKKEEKIKYPIAPKSIDKTI